MREIKDRAQIDAWVEAEHIRDTFDTRDLSFGARRFAKGEIIASPDAPLRELLFLVEGAVQIYGIRADGSFSPINFMTAPGMLGDVEYCNGISPFFVEARTETVCVSLDVAKYRACLDQDIRFLHRLLRSFADKLEHFSMEETISSSVEERVLFYLRSVSPEHELRGIEESLLRLRCGRRQLQRVLGKLLAEGRIRKIGRGRYRLESGDGQITE